MSGLLGDLLNASKSLATQGYGLQITGKNIANIDNPNYARQSVVLGERGSVKTALGVQGMGVEALGISQARDRYLDAQVTREVSRESYLQTQATQYQKAQAYLGESVGATSNSADINDPASSTTGISSSLNNFFNAAESVASDPTDAGAKQILVLQAESLANKINSTDARLEALQNNITQEVDFKITAVNDLLKEISVLNTEIQKVEINGYGGAVDARDQRQGKLEELAKYMDFTATEIPGQFGQIQITAATSTGTSVVLVDKGTSQSVSFDGTNFYGGSPATQLGLQGGSMVAQVAARDGAIADLRSTIQAVASQVIAAVNNAYNPGGGGNDFFKAGPPGLMQVDPTLTPTSLKTTATGQSGANELAVAIADVANKRFSVSGGDTLDGTISEFYSKKVSGFGLTLQSTESRATDQEIVTDLVKSMRNSISGVSMDEELTNLMQYQRGYQASARLINIIDSLLDLIINGMGATR